MFATFFLILLLKLNFKNVSNLGFRKQTIVMGINVLLFRGLFDKFSEQHGEVQNTAHEHKGHLSHELIAGAGKL